MSFHIERKSKNIKIVGLTGGIGSGKSTLSRVFESLGVPVYEADKEAKELMQNSKVIKNKLIALFGTQAYKNDELNRSFLASKIFNNKDLLSKMNAIVHPEVAAHFKIWLKKQNYPYVIKESAIIFENHLEQQYDLIITVVADEDKRLKRVLQRNNTNKEKVISIIKNQMRDNEKIKKSDFVIYNNLLSEARAEAVAIHHKILEAI